MVDNLKPINVLITAAGAPGAAGIIKSLRTNGERKIRISACDMNPESAGLYLADKAFIVPPGTSDKFVPRLLDISQKDKIDVIIPLATDELMPLALGKNRFGETGTNVAISDPDCLEIANNKAKLYSFLSEHNQMVPRFKVVNNLSDFTSAVFDLGYPQQPVCLKPQVSKGGRGFRIIKEGLDRLDLLLNRKPDNTFTDFKDIVSILKCGDPFPELVVMEYLPGDEYSIDLLLKKGVSFVSVPRKRDFIKMGVSFIGTVEDNREISIQAEEIAKSLSLDYCVNMQFKYGADGEPKIIEINPRVSGTIVMCTGAGVNLPYLAVKLALGEEINAVKPNYGVRMFRYWDEIFVDKEGKSFSLKDLQA